MVMRREKLRALPSDTTIALVVLCLLVVYIGCEIIQLAHSSTAYVRLKHIPKCSGTTRYNRSKGLRPETTTQVTTSQSARKLKGWRVRRFQLLVRRGLTCERTPPRE
jgi:hypothetical protein